MNSVVFKRSRTELRYVFNSNHTVPVIWATVVWRSEYCVMNFFISLMQNSSPCCMNSSSSDGFSNAISTRWLLPLDCCCVGRSGRDKDDEVDEEVGDGNGVVPVCSPKKPARPWIKEVESAATFWPQPTIRFWLYNWSIFVVGNRKCSAVDIIGCVVEDAEIEVDWQSGLVWIWLADTGNSAESKGAPNKQLSGTVIAQRWLSDCVSCCWSVWNKKLGNSNSMLPENILFALSRSTWGECVGWVLWNGIISHLPLILLL